MSVSLISADIYWRKAVIHPNLEATVAATWQQWQVPLSDVASAGVNLASIIKMSIMTKAGAVRDP